MANIILKPSSIENLAFEMFKPANIKKWQMNITGQLKKINKKIRLLIKWNKNHDPYNISRISFFTKIASANRGALVDGLANCSNVPTKVKSWSNNKFKISKNKGWSSYNVV